MHILLIVAGLLLLVFGGGCTLIMGGFAIMDWRSTLNDFASVASLLGGLGLLPLAAGWFLFRHGVRIDREKRKAAAERFRHSEKGQN